MKTKSIKTLRNKAELKSKYMKKYFCPVCGELKVKDGKIIHPEMDIEIAKRLKSGIKTYYTNKD